MLAKDQEIAFLLSYQLEHVRVLVISQSTFKNVLSKLRTRSFDSISLALASLPSLDMNLSSPDADMTNGRELNSSTILDGINAKQDAIYMLQTNKQYKITNESRQNTQTRNYDRK